MKKRFFCLILVSLILILPLVSCSQGTSLSTQAPTTQQVSSPPAELIISPSAGYRIVYPEDFALSERSIADTLFTALLSRIKVKADLKDDSTEAEREIHVGFTNKARSEFDAELKLKDYRIVAKDGNLYFLGGSEESLEKAVDHFVDSYVKRGESQVNLPGDFEYDFCHDYTLKDPTLNGSSLSNYTVLIPEQHDRFTLYAAQNLIDFVKQNAGIRLSLKTGAPTEAAEIVIGGNPSVDLKEGQFSLHREGNDLILNGNGYMVGGAVGKLINGHLIRTEEIPTAATATDFQYLPTENAILLIGDGMGKNHVEAAKKEGLLPFAAEALPYRTDCTTYSVSVARGDSEYTDSAAAATALSTGIKTLNSYLGMDEKEAVLTNAREYAHSAGANTAILTTDVITGATPAGFLAHVNERTLTSQIQDQIDDLLEANEVQFALGSLGDKLTEASAEALHSISEKNARFFAMIEEGIIDKHSHNNLYSPMLDTMDRFDDLISYVIEFSLIHPDTALLITADHETGGLTHNEATEEYYFTVGTHTNADVTLYMAGYDAESFTNGPVDNTDIGNYLCGLYRS